MTTYHTGRWTVTGVLVAWVACAGPSPLSENRIVHAIPQVSLADVAATIQADLTNSATGGLPPAERATLTALYRSGEFQPVWLEAQGGPTSDARESLATLAGAREDGLDPTDYRLDQLRALAGRIATATSSRDLADFDLALSRSMLRYLGDLRVGRIDPRTVGFRLPASSDRPDTATILRSALAAHRITAAVEEQRPQLDQYAAMRMMLARYRSLAEDTTLEPLPSSEVVHPGDTYVGLPILYHRLVALGDLPKDTTAPSTMDAFDGPLVEGLKRFQARHGLEQDGVLGRQTQAALRVPFAQRVRQIELSLERLRWWPDQRSQRLVAINIPMFRLWAWDSVPPSDPPALGSAVIVGRAVRTETPVLVEEMREVIFRPYWNVPPSILRNEILPAIRRNPDYLLDEDMEIVRGPGDDAQPVEATAENLVLLRQGALRLRQRVGPRNALGLVKFVFPNEENVYLHGTPGQALFSRSRRDFSHGCVRVENATELAEWVFKGQPEWTRDRILDAMNGTPSRHVTLAQPIQVILFYMTAAVMPEDGTIYFAEDIYRLDGRLDRALARRRPLE